MRLEKSATKAATGCAEVSLSETFAAFPGALETTARLIADWIEAQRELCERLVRDRRVIESTFLRSRRSPRVIAIRPGLSDPHGGGRTVTLIEFAGNAAVVYKPRALDGEILWFAALRWLERNKAGASFRSPTLVSRKNYSWMEFVKRRSCKAFTDLRRFYFRWGAQTALAQLLRASDLHRENWIAAGSQPVLVDAELIAGNHQDRQSLSALLDTGLLPLTAKDRAGFYQGVAPFDAMLADAGTIRCWPRYQNVLKPPSRYVNELVRGFEAVAKILAEPRRAKQFLAILRARQRGKKRVLFRPTAKYARILLSSLSPLHMSSARQRQRWLARECCASAASRAIGRAEVRALFRCDIPRFERKNVTGSISWKCFSAEINKLARSSRLLRSRILLGS